MKKYYFLLLGILSILISSCGLSPDLENLELRNPDAEFAFPILNADYSMYDLLDAGSDSAEIILHPNGDVCLLYSGQVYEGNSDEVFQVVPGGLPFPVLDSVDIVKLPFDKMIIRRMFLKGDSIYFLFNSDLQEDVDVSLTIPKLKKNNQSFNISGTIKYEGQSNSLLIIGEDLKDYDFIIDTNSFEVKYDARNQKGERILLQQVRGLYTTLDFYYVEGYFTKNNHTIPRDTIRIDVYDHLVNGSLYFEDPKVSFEVRNSFGFPVKAIFHSMRVKGLNGDEFELSSPKIQDGIDFNYPSINQVGEYRSTVFTFDTLNSNIREVFNSQPVELDYHIEAISNPDEDPTIIGFMTDTSKFTINTIVELPIHGRATNFTTEEDIQIDMSPLEEFKTAEFKLITTNSFPVDILMQVEFYNAQDQLLDSLFEGMPTIFEGAPVGSQGYSSGESQVIKFVEMDQARLEKIKEASYARILLSFSTTPEDVSVKVNQENGIVIKMGVKTALK